MKIPVKKRHYGSSRGAFFEPWYIGRINMANRYRPDHDGAHRLIFERNKKKILATQSICGICGKTVDKKIPYPNPMSPCIDHIIPIDKGGHPSDIENMQLAHMTCNRQKSNRLVKAGRQVDEVISNRILPQSCDWTKYKDGQKQS